MNDENKHWREFGSFRLDAEKKVLWHKSEPVHLPLKAVEMLCVLTQNPGEVITKDALLEAVWQNTFVEESVLTQNVYQLRKTLRDLGGTKNLIQNVPRRGYRFTGQVRPAGDELVIEHHIFEETIVEVVENGELKAGTGPTNPVNSRLPIGRFKKSPGKLRLWAAAPAVLLILVMSLIFTFRSFQKKEEAADQPIHSIAVLPFKSLDETGDQKHLSLGLTDNLNLKLGGLKEIIVRPASVVSSQSKDETDPLLIGRKLQVEAVLEGNLQTEGDRVRVTVRLLRVIDGAQLWAGKFDERLSSIFELQDSLSSQVSNALALNLSGEEKQILAKHYTTNLDAYQYYVDGMYELHKGTPDGWKKSLEDFKLSIAEDPRYPLPYAGMAVSYDVLCGFGLLAPDEAMPKAKEAALKAVELDDSLSKAHLALAMVKAGYDWDWKGAEAEFRRAIELAPTASAPRNTYAHFLLAMNRPAEAVAESRHALEVDASDVYMNEDLAWVYLTARQYEQAAAQSRKTLEMDSRDYGAYLILGWIAEQQGKYPEAIAEIEKAQAIESDNTFVEVALCYNLARAGRRDEAEKILKTIREKAAREYISPYFFAILYAGFEDKEQVFTYLDRAYNERISEMIALRNETKFDFMRSDRRFQKLLQKMNLTE